MAMASAKIMMRSMRRGIERATVPTLNATSKKKLSTIIKNPLQFHTYSCSFCTTSSQVQAPTISDADFTRHSDVALNEILERLDGIEPLLPEADITLSVLCYFQVFFYLFSLSLSLVVLVIIYH